MSGQAVTVINRGLGVREQLTNRLARCSKAEGVSDRFVYAPGVREHIEAARAQQARTATTGDEPRSAGGATQNQELNSQLTQLQYEEQELERRLAQTNDDLVAARASLRYMIRTESTENLSGRPW
ncbi:hypothetical protein GTW43_35895 [Streptomyces sp. SID5785]|uniref:hypothetical protein n=1 Tax=Streptomyces sp. SID5785 TaxID=2690309 RepID=UPI001360C7B5|nr:hypothetical protein [Streptomyces sp. SID5785]MZD10422.1 hypothetical protein [Streptomyces sp. SID5785]